MLVVEAAMCVGFVHSTCTRQPLKGNKAHRGLTDITAIAHIDPLVDMIS